MTIVGLLTLFSGLLLVSQLLLEFITYFVCKYIDYFRLAIELDKNEGTVTKYIFRKEIKATKIEKKAFKVKGESYYTKQEQKIIDVLVADARKYKEEKEKKLKVSIKNSKQIIKQSTQKGLTHQQVVKIDEKFVIMLDKAKMILTDSEELDKLLIKIENKIDKLPKEVEALKYIPIFVSMINNFISKKYTNISKEFVLSIIALIAYFVMPIDVIPDYVPVVGYLDESYLIGNCINQFENELTKFIMWRDTQNN